MDWRLGAWRSRGLLVWCWRRWVAVPCVLMATLLGCTREEPPAPQITETSQLAVDSTPAFRNLGKRAESTL